MPYLRVTCPQLPREEKSRIAQALTSAINDLFFNPHSPISREQLSERTTVQFTAYVDGDLYIGGRTPIERSSPDITVELSDWNMSERQQRKVARGLTPVIAELFSLPASASESINIRFHPYPPKDFSVGGRLLSEVIPRTARVAKHLFG